MHCDLKLKMILYIHASESVSEYYSIEHENRSGATYSETERIL